MSAFEEANDKKSKTSSKFYDVSGIEKHAFEKAFERLWAKAESASLYTVPGTNGYTLHVQGIKSVKITFDHIDVTRMIVLQSKHRKNTKLLFLMTSVMMACLRLQTENASDGTAKAQEYCKSILATFVQTTLEETGVVYFRDEAMLCLVRPLRIPLAVGAPRRYMRVCHRTNRSMRFLWWCHSVVSFGGDPRARIASFLDGDS